MHVFIQLGMQCTLKKCFYFLFIFQSELGFVSLIFVSYSTIIRPNLGNTFLIIRQFFSNSPPNIKDSLVYFKSRRYADFWLPSSLYSYYGFTPRWCRWIFSIWGSVTINAHFVFSYCNLLRREMPYWHAPFNSHFVFISHRTYIT